MINITNDINVTYEEIIYAFSSTLNMVDKNIYHHHSQVAYIAYHIAKEMKIPPAEIKDIVMTGLIHDIGVNTQEDINELKEEANKKVKKHTIRGYVLLEKNCLLCNLADAIRYHHTFWDYGKNFVDIDEKTSLMTQIIFLADRIAIYSSKRRKNILLERDVIVEKIKSKAGKVFKPETVEAFLATAKKPDFWLDIVTNNEKRTIRQILRFEPKKASFFEFIELCKFFIYSIDFRSRYTACHSFGVALVAEKLTSLYGESEKIGKAMKVAGYLHDIGKLTVPIKILDKQGSLTKEEFSLVMQHPYYTYYFLDKMKGLKMFKEISGYHHETVNGTGYPFRIEPEKMSDLSRIMCISDKIAALTEDRPYREAMNNEKVIEILRDMIENKQIDNAIGKIAIENLEEIIHFKSLGVVEIIDDFAIIKERYEELLKQTNNKN
jgi:HD-GYP domain-containing protein (c-di-GMP phosphodiesterase class II)